MSTLRIRTRHYKAVKQLVGVGLVGVTLLGTAACSDDKGACTDTDVSADPAGRFDRGPAADPHDLGNTDTDTGSADPALNGRRCSDFD